MEQTGAKINKQVRRQLDKLKAQMNYTEEQERELIEAFKKEHGRTPTDGEMIQLKNLHAHLKFTNKTCAACGLKEDETCFDKDKKLKRCSRCHKAYYCSKSCQTAHWPVHKLYCIDKVGDRFETVRYEIPVNSRGQTVLLIPVEPIAHLLKGKLCEDPRAIADETLKHNDFLNRDYILHPMDKKPVLPLLQHEMKKYVSVIGIKKFCEQIAELESKHQ